MCTQPANAQDMEPRAYSNAPTGTNFLLGGYSYSRGEVSLDSALPISGVKAKIGTTSVGYSRTFGLFGRLASAAAIVPYINGDLSGDVGEEHREITRDGVGDMRFRAAINLLGGPALTPKEFAQRPHDTTLGFSTVIVAPSGEYNSEHLINIGANRWAFKPEIGLSQPLGDWFLDGAAGVWLYTDNQNFYGGKRRSQDPIPSFQLHGGYNFLPGVWLAADATYWTGGKTSLDGVHANDLQSNSRYGLTLSLPITKSYSFKVGWSTGLTTRVGGDFDTFLAAVQYRWFDTI